MKVYIANAFSLNMLDEKEALIYVKEITLDEVKNILNENDFVSAIGHQSTSQVLSQILGINIEMNRIQIKLQENDEIIIFQLQTRLEEGKVLSEDELKQLQYKFYLIKMIRRA
jgi:hypothetical protein